MEVIMAILSWISSEEAKEMQTHTPKTILAKILIFSLQQRIPVFFSLLLSDIKMLLSLLEASDFK
jgi:hypothetical protein